MNFVSIGGVWLDEIHASGKEVLRDVAGGAVAFATIGARLFTTDPCEIGFIIKTGFDFPSALLGLFATWTPNLLILPCPGQPSARGRVHYGESSSDRLFTRLTPSLNTTPSDLINTPLLGANCFHFFDTVAAVSSQIDELCSLRQDAGIASKPLVIWEPHPKSCTPKALEEHKQLVASGKVPVFSPNHVELGAFFRASNDTSDASFDRGRVERQSRAFLPSSTEAKDPHDIVCILIRCAEHGCFVLHTPPSCKEHHHSAWLPPFFGLEQSDRIVDPTGAGNAFLGGFAMGWLETHDFVRAAAYGNVAASFALEVVGLPDVASCDAKSRLAEYERRL
ncbi:hypothetical protein B0A48_13380 [Cryoendolithus antarcticus]|uniref:Carbohydrate kinase PfkB domain-containing protein n=1 Tax=Cryoendolithus antarcticus TaxID=1507870 RepID=A0A1V8SPR4_9PEZI|nr:hypothetical protein B0A48_13380 [Cryoendolithus antarcticus]